MFDDETNGIDKRVPLVKIQKFSVQIFHCGECHWKLRRIKLVKVSD